MGIDIPVLDDWEYAEIIEDARRGIPTYSEAWTDHNATDPGITILELLAWLSETYTYQFDQITDDHRQKYVRLMGEQVRPPKPAQVDLTVQLPKSSGRVAIPKGTPLKAKEGMGKTRVFETTEDVILSSVRIDRVISESEHNRIDNTTANATDGMHFLAFGERAEEGSSMYLRFKGDPFVMQSDGDSFEPNRENDPLATGTLALNVAFHEDGLPDPAVHGEASGGCGAPIEFEPTVDLAWQYCLSDRVGNGMSDEDPPESEPWTKLLVQKDETNQLYQGGTVMLKQPAGWEHSETERLWIRCVVQNDGYEIPPPIDTLRTDVVTADQRKTITDETLRSPAGEQLTTALPGQLFSFEHTPVLEADIEIDGELWQRTMDFDTSQPDDPHYVLDEGRGEIRFGDGVRGMIPPAGHAVRARQYRSGGGTGGNMSDAASWEFSLPDVRRRDSKRQSQTRRLNSATVMATGPATGGVNAESVEIALKRVRKDRTVPYRAVSLEDYQLVAVNTPGLRFGRAVAHVISDDRIGNERLQEVRVVIVPYSTTDEPMPSKGFLEAVQQHLEHHRLLTDRVQVEPPTYVGIGVDAEVRLVPGYSREGRITAVTNRLDEFLDPLQGFNGTGWPFGRSLYRSELHEAIKDVEGVDAVLDLAIRTQNERAVDSRGTVLIDETALLSSLGHTITVRMDSIGERGDL